MKIKIAIIVIAIVILLLAAPGCRMLKHFDPEGTWQVIRTYGATNDAITFVFAGSRSSGIVAWNDYVIGTYIFYYNDDVRFSAQFPEGILAEKTVTESYQGRFDEKDIMNGTFTWNRDGVTLMGEWVAYRVEETL